MICLLSISLSVVNCTPTPTHEKRRAEITSEKMEEEQATDPGHKTTAQIYSILGDL